MASKKSPLAYTGRVQASSTRQGDSSYDSTDFSVTDGTVSLSGTGAVETVNSLAPTAGNIVIAGTTGEIDVASAGSTVTLSLDAELPVEAEVTLTSAQVKALAATQIELVPAPGAGKMIKFMGASLKLVYGGTNAFTESSITFGIKYTDDTGVQVSQTIEATGWIDQTASTYTNAEPKIDAIVAASAAENQALVLDNLGAGEVAGNAANDNTVVVSVLYRIVEI